MTHFLNRKLLIIIATAITYFSIFSSYAAANNGANLMLTPTRVVLENRMRSEKITLHNSGTGTTTYEISLINKRMDENGNFSNITAGDKAANEKFADDFIRISPKRVTLAAGTSQVVRVLARKPADLADGEYRSHIVFREISKPLASTEASELENQEQQIDKVNIQMQANIGISIPIIVRQGNLTKDVSASQLKLTTKAGKKYLNFTLVRNGTSSSYGDINISYKNTSGKLVNLKKMSGVAIYTPNNKRNFSIPLNTEEGVKLESGTIQLNYEEEQQKGKKVLVQQEMTL